ncbi:GNAT family N-acetyltransferase [Streptomyces sp. NPDC019531]|uniref:GNAT family N-acetyltransferase n=1 Tax=Streptomyces sp. NPDC019531 TaxID=3365062 RepID=UPI00384B9AEF
MAIVLDAVSAPPVPTLGGGWTLRQAGDPAGVSRAALSVSVPDTRTTARTYAATCDGGPAILLEIHRVPHHTLRACYPFGAHDLAVEVVLPAPGPSGQAPASRLLRELVPALFAADPRCRRVVAAPAEDDSPAQRALEAAGFRRVTEADLPGGTVVLFTAEPPAVAGVSTALDDMPH